MLPIINIFINTPRLNPSMKGFIITHKGMENIASLEIKELINKNSEINEACIVFDIKNYDDLFRLCYKSQSSIGIYYLLGEFECNDLFTDFKKNIKKIDFTGWLSKKTEFRLKCIKNYDNKSSTPNLEKRFGEIIIDHIQQRYNYKQKVNLDNPEIIILTYLVENKCFVGIDFAGFDLSRRSYKILQHPADIKGTIGYFLVRLSNYQKKESILDPYSASGTITIEAALFASKFPINFFNKEKFIFLNFDKFIDYDFKKLFKKLDKEILSSKLYIYNFNPSMIYLNYSKKNSKIAGIGKKIIFSRMDIEWMDTKFDKGKINKIVTIMPIVQEKQSKEIYNEFFYQADFILDNKGEIILIGDKDLIKEYSSKYKFKITEKKIIVSGKKQYEIFVLAK